MSGLRNERFYHRGEYLPASNNKLFIKNSSMKFDPIFDSGDPQIYQIKTSGEIEKSPIPFSDNFLKSSPSGDIFGIIQNTGMGWNTTAIWKKQFLIISTQGGLRDTAGRPIALGYHTGHWEISDLVKTAAEEIQHWDAIPFAGFCSDPCDGRTQGTAGMLDSLPYRNDAAIIFRRLIRSLPTRHGVLGIATCDKGLPAMMMALASLKNLPAILIPGGVTLPPREGEDLGTIQSIGARYAQGEVTLQYAQEMGCRACGSAGGGCQFLGTAATSQVVGEALGLSLTHSALTPSGQKIWLDMAKRSARALLLLEKEQIFNHKILCQKSFQNAMTIHAAFGGSTNLLLHIPAIAHAAGFKRPTVEDWIKINRTVPRLVDVLPNGPVGHPTVRLFLAGGVPEVMLHLRELNLLNLDVYTVSGKTLEQNLDWWEKSDRRKRLRDLLFINDGVDPSEVIFSPDQAGIKKLTNTLTFPKGNLAPEGSVIKSTAIDPSVLHSEGLYNFIGKAKVFTSEKAAINAVKGGRIEAGDVLVLVCLGPMGSGMEETFQITSALKGLSWGKHVAVITDGRFSGVSTGACIGHVGPEALAGGPIGKVIDGDLIHIWIDLKKLEGKVNLVGEKGCPEHQQSITRGNKILSQRQLRPDLKSHQELPADTKLWAALQHISGGTWGGCVYDVKDIIKKLTSESSIRSKNR
jgi:putative YjhG/YagF family dehydratase